MRAAATHSCLLGRSAGLDGEAGSDARNDNLFCPLLAGQRPRCAAADRLNLLHLCLLRHFQSVVHFDT